MKRFIFILLTLVCTAIADAQTYTVYRAKGSVFQITNGKSKAVKANQTLSADDVINVGASSLLELLDEKYHKKITVRTPGQNTVSKMLSSKKNSIIDISSSYLSYMKNQITQKKENDMSDPATITMHGAKKDSTRTAAEDDTIANFVKSGLKSNDSYGFRQMTKDEYENFRSLCWEQYLDFMRNAWDEYGASDAETRPKIVEVKPVIYNASDKPLEAKAIEINAGVVLDATDSAAQPMPITKIPEVKGVSERLCDFLFFGTPCKVRIPSDFKLHISNAGESGIMEALKILGTKSLDNTIRDCLEIRYDMQLSDWAYLLMLQAMSDAVCGNGTNEATLLCSYIYLQTGYKMRFATDGEKVYMLIACKHSIYDRNYYKLDGERYYSFSELPSKLKISNVKYPNEESLSLCITKAIKLAERNTEERTIVSEQYPDVSVSVHVNANLMNFYSSYPSSHVGDNPVSRWAMYANTPMQSSVADQIYPALRKAIYGCDKYEAVCKLLDFVQTGLKYEFDENVWGADRAFFAEETLYYPYCDCEDRSVLFTRLVRDLLGLKCVLVYYPGHLASAVNIPGHDGGDYVEVNGKRYTVTDPTYIGAAPGCTMPAVAGEKPEVVTIEK